MTGWCWESRDRDHKLSMTKLSIDHLISRLQNAWLSCLYAIQNEHNLGTSYSSDETKAVKWHWNKGQVETFENEMMKRATTKINKKDFLGLRPFFRKYGPGFFIGWRFGNYSKSYQCQNNANRYCSQDDVHTRVLLSCTVRNWKTMVQSFIAICDNNDCLFGPPPYHARICLHFCTICR